MLTQNSLPSSTEATKSFLSDHGKEEFLCDWKCLKCYSRRRNNYGDDSCYSLNLSAVGSSTISESSTTPFFVYRRRKPQRNTTSYAKTKAGDNICVSAVSNEATTKEKHLDFPHVVKAPLMLPLQCNRGASATPLSKSGSIIDEDDRQKDVVVDVCYVNDSCSSSKSANRDLCSATVVVDDTGECSSSGAFLTMEGLRCNVSEKDLCISILKREGVLQGRMQPSSSSDSSSCLRSCKACDRPETTLKMLICDHCEEAFHVSCCNPRVKKIPGDEWFCYSCLKKKQKILKEATINAIGRSRSATNSALSPIKLMLKDTRPHQSNVRVGKDFQAVVPDWSGPILDGADNIGEPLRMNPSECRRCQDCSASKPSRISSIGNWLQCCAIIDGVGESVNGTICGKWRRAPLFEVQTDEWECFRSFIWDPTHSDCAVPQELDTKQVLKQLKYIEMLRPRLAAKRRKLDHTKRVDSEEPANSVRHTQTT